MAHVKKGIRTAMAQLNRSPENALAAAQAIMTSDTRAKEIAVEFQLDKLPVRIGGICKGAGMIQPGMSLTGRPPAATPLHATMLCFLTTDAAIDSPALKSALNQAVGQSFNRISVDGDMSTNDTVLILANGLAENLKISRRTPKALELFQEALNFVTLHLAKMIVLDGEGVSRFVTIHLRGARSFAEADRALRSVGHSPLVKTSWCGGDPNWGRILAALGYSSANVIEEKVDLGYSLPGGRHISWALKQGRPTATPLAALKKITGQKEFDLHIHLHVGQAGATFYTSDLTEEYVDFNKGE
jgi:glutamate N-acetyltransferase / amino-acid N-acetyltransferase